MNRYWTTPLPINVARSCWSYIWFMNGITLGLFLPSMIDAARAAETLPAVSPPTDFWFGIAVVVGIGLLIFLPIIYAVYVKLKSGTQPGEQAIDKLLDALNKSHTTIQTQAAALQAQAGQPIHGTLELAADPAKPIASQPPAKFPADWT